MSNVRRLCLIMLFAFTLAGAVFALGGASETTFIYQGPLPGTGNSHDGLFDLEFSLCRTFDGDNQIGTSKAINNVEIINGLLTVQLDFGQEAFDNSVRWLGVAIDGVVLSPRQENCIA